LLLSKEEISEKIDKCIEKAQERNFEENIDLSINLKNIDLSDPNNRIDEEVILPNNLGRGVKVCFIGGGNLAVEAKDVADLVISSNELENLEDNKTEARSIAKGHDFFLAEASLMPKIGKILGPILGPRGKMPNPVRPDEDIVPKIKKLRNTVRVRSKESTTFHTTIGAINIGIENLSENARTILRRIERELPMGRNNIDSIYVKTTMGPPVKLI